MKYLFVESSFSCFHNHFWCASVPKDLENIFTIYFYCISQQQAVAFSELNFKYWWEQYCVMFPGRIDCNITLNLADTREHVSSEVSTAPNYVAQQIVKY